MLGNFTFHNPTKLHFGEDALSKLSEELKQYGKKVMLCYGGGSIKRNGIYDQVIAELRYLRVLVQLVWRTWISSSV